MIILIILRPPLFFIKKRYNVPIVFGTHNNHQVIFNMHEAI